MCIRDRDYGVWIPYTWKEQYEAVKYFSLGLISFGLQPGDRIITVGDNNVHWIWAAAAAILARAAFAAVFTEFLPREIAYVVTYCTPKFAVAGDQEQVDKFLDEKLREELSCIKKIIYWDPKGLRTYRDPRVMSFDEVVEVGKKYSAEHPDVFEENIKASRPDDVVQLSWTSGTTATQPKAVEITNEMLIANMEMVKEAWEFVQGDRFGLVAPPVQFPVLMVTLLAMREGIPLFCPEIADTARLDMREIAPTQTFGSAEFSFKML